MKKRDKKNKLDIIALAFTNRCNLSCAHCGYDFKSKNKKQELPTGFFLNILKEAKKLGAKSFNITGGEVFLRNDCLSLVERAVDLGYSVSIESNGTLIKTKHLDCLKSLGLKVRIAISLDGITPKIHDSIRGKNTFLKTHAILKKISQAAIPARVNTVLQINNFREIPRLARYVVEDLGLGYRLLPFILEQGRGACICKTDAVPINETENLLNNFYYPFMREKKSQNITIGLNVALVPLDIHGHLICPWGKAMIGIGPNGIASLCHVCNDNQEMIFGDLKKTPLAEIWETNLTLAKFRDINPDQILGVCGNCEANKVCRGGCRVSALSRYHGNFFAPDPQCQSYYNLGKFPSYALRNKGKDCYFNDPA